MDVVLTIARIALAGIWSVAAIGKLLDRGMVPAPLLQLGLPGWITRTTAHGLPLFELLLAAMLLSGSHARLGAILSLGLLTGFVIVLASATRRGVSEGCGCLGRLERNTPPLVSLVRTELLTALAAGIVWLGWGRPFPSLIPLLTSSHPWPWIMIAAAGAVGFRKPLATGWGRVVDFFAWRAQTGLTPLAGLPIGTPAPISYRPQVLEALVFVRDQCAPCEQLLGTLPERAAVAAIRIVSVGGRGSESTRAYRVPGVPAAVLIGPDGRIASSLAVGAVAVRTLLGQA